MVTPAKLEYFRKKIDSVAIAKEVIETSEMSDKTRSIFKVMVNEAEKGDEEAWEILRDRLAGWLCKNQPL